MSKDELGDRMKAYERMSSGKSRLDADLPVIARIDGRSFSKFTKPFKKPFDTRITDAMDATTAYLVKETHANIGYTQSDEITLVWHVDRSKNDAAQILFDGRTQKLCSVLAGMATSAFTLSMLNTPDIYMLCEKAVQTRRPHFDCRVWNVPDRREAANTVLWRFLDARKNSVSAFARSHISHKAMQGLSSQGQIDAVIAAGGPDYHEAVTKTDKFGRSFYRQATERRLTDVEWHRIPEAHRPERDAQVTRTEVVRRTFDWIEIDREAAIFRK